MVGTNEQVHGSNARRVVMHEGRYPWLGGPRRFLATLDCATSNELE